METLLSGLNEAQTHAVCHSANTLQVLAPPGSGKTKTLTSRVGYLITKHGLQPQDVIVCTFTVKAANEMQSRIAGFLGRDVAKSLILGTFHSIARRFLAQWGEKIGLPAKFSIADSADTTALIKDIVKRLEFDSKDDNDDTDEEQQKEKKGRSFNRRAKDTISTLKSKGLDSEVFSQMPDTRKDADQRKIAMVYSEYERQLRLSGLLDFDDLILRCIDLLSAHPRCVEKIEAVLIDEFQDTSNMQYKLMTLFAQSRRTITIVGDPDQSIYGWRNAEIGNLTKMQMQYEGTCVVNLEENYRSSGAILRAAQAVIEQDKSRHSKQLMPTHGHGMMPVLRKLPSEEDEAEWITSEIKRTSALSGGLLEYSDYAVLLRSLKLSGRIESALIKEGIPYRVVRGSKFFERAEIKLVLDYLAFIDNPERIDALVRIVNTPPRGVGPATMEILLEESRRQKMTLWELILGMSKGRVRISKMLPRGARDGVGIFVNLIVAAHRNLLEPPSEWTTIGDFLIWLITSTDLDDYLRTLKNGNFESRWANVQELIALSAEYSNSARLEILKDPRTQGIQNAAALNGYIFGETVSRFLEHVALSAAGANENENTQQVAISTIHGAKGLEWPVVFIASAYNGFIPLSVAKDTDEERRLLYVAMTRAQVLLNVSCPSRTSGGMSRGGDKSLSPFLDHPDVELFFNKCGPDIEFSTTQGLARTLGRPAPTKDRIEEACTILCSKADDQWPADCAEDLSASSRLWMSANGGQNQAQRPANHLHMTTSSMREAELSVNSTTLSTSFTTASRLLTTQRQAESESKQKQNIASQKESEPERPKSPTSPQKKESKPKQNPAFSPSKKRKADDPGQRKLSFFWQNRT